MQIKKDELRQGIYKAACHEILHKGYDRASMRSIMKRANTSIGNFYHYYESKEDLMDEMMTNAYIKIDQLMIQHFSLDTKLSSLEELDYYLKSDAWWKDNFGIVLCPEVAIYIQQDLAKYQKQKEIFLAQMRTHVANHMNVKSADDYIVHIVVKMFLDGFIIIVKGNVKKEQALYEFTRLFRSICGIIIPYDQEENKDETI